LSAYANYTKLQKLGLSFKKYNFSNSSVTFSGFENKKNSEIKLILKNVTSNVCGFSVCGSCTVNYLHCKTFFTVYGCWELGLPPSFIAGSRFSNTMIFAFAISKPPPTPWVKNGPLQGNRSLEFFVVGMLEEAFESIKRIQNLIAF
jgi:hypothetical protein